MVLLVRSLVLPGLVTVPLCLSLSRHLPPPPHLLGVRILATRAALLCRHFLIRSVWPILMSLPVGVGAWQVFLSLS